VRVFVADRGELEQSKLDNIIAAAKPAHVPHSLEIVVRSRDGGGR
jgi:hypothetical protein